MKVLKFGGSVLQNADDIRRVADIVLKQYNTDHRFIVIVSALYGITNQLAAMIELVHNDINYTKQYEEITAFHMQILEQLQIKCNTDGYKSVMELLILMSNVMISIKRQKIAKPSDKDLILSFGERLSSTIIYHFLHLHFPEKVGYMNSCNLIKTNNNFTHASVDLNLSRPLIQEFIAQHPYDITIGAGFIGSNTTGQITTLGRNGSDYTAALIASAVGADVLEIWKDTDGLFTADPKIVKNVKFIKKITYQEMAELSSLGNKVVHIDAIAPCIAAEIPIFLKNCHNPDNEGTKISKEEYQNYFINGIVKMDGVYVVTILFDAYTNTLNITGQLQELYDTYSDIIITISQNIKQRRLSLLVSGDNIHDFTTDLTNIISKNKNNNIKINTEGSMSMITIVGAYFATFAGLSGKIFSVLEKNNINIDYLHDDFSKTRISFLCATQDANNIVNLLHNELVR